MHKPVLFAGLFAAGTLFASVAAAQALTSFTAGDIVVERIGDGSATLTSSGTAVFLDEYTTTGTLVGSYALPTTGTTPLVDSGTATSDGEISLSADGQFLLVPGYDAALGTATVASSAAATVPREVATVGAAGALVQTTINNYDTNNIRGVASPDGTTLFTTGGNVGVLSVASGAMNATGTVVSSTSTNNRGVAIYGGQLYVSSGSGTFRIATVGTGVSSAAGQTATEVPGIAAGTTTGTLASPYGFVATSLGGGSIDTIYVAENGSTSKTAPVTSAIEKFSLSGGSFTLTGTVSVSGATFLGLTGMNVAGGEQLFATTTAGIYSLTDLTGAGGTLTATPNQIVTAGTNETFRGIAFAPVASTVPEPSAFAMLGAGMLGLWTLARRARGSRE